MHEKRKIIREYNAAKDALSLAKRKFAKGRLTDKELAIAQETYGKVKASLDLLNSKQLLKNTEQINASINARTKRTEDRMHKSTKTKGQVNKMEKHINWDIQAPGIKRFLVAQYLLQTSSPKELAKALSVTPASISTTKTTAKTLIQPFNQLTEAGDCPYTALLEELFTLFNKEEKTPDELYAEAVALREKQSAKSVVEPQEEIEKHAAKTVESTFTSSQKEEQTEATQIAGETQINVRPVPSHEIVLKSVHDEAIKMIENMTDVQLELRRRLETEQAEVARITRLFKEAEVKLEEFERNAERYRQEREERTAYIDELRKEKEIALIQQERQFQRDAMLEREDRAQLRANAPAGESAADVQTLLDINDIYAKNLRKRLELK